LRNLKLAVAAICVVAFSTVPLKAQYIGDQFPGLVGLNAGSQPGPGIYITLPLYYRDSNIGIYDPHGNQVLNNFTAGINVIALPSIAVVTPFKIFGATYGASYSEWIINGVVNVAALNYQRATSYGFGDIYVQPATLGWHGPVGDVTLGYAFFAPTGAGSSGQHMWVNEIDAGATVYLDGGKKWNVSTMSYYDFNRRKNNTDIKVGNILTLAGGIGRSFLKGAGSAGVAYGAQWKMAHDTGTDIPPILPTTNGRFFALGPEVNVPVFTKGLNLGLVGFRYLWIVGPKTSLGGQLLVASFTFAHIIPPKPKK